MLTRPLLHAFVAFLCVPVLVSVAQPLQLVQGGKSAYSIYYDPASPSSVKDAAAEIQTYVAKATGAKLPIVTQFPATPVIALGNNPQLAANGLNLDGVKIEGYRIVTKGTNLFIFGEDTPDKQRTAEGGFSRGTANGAYTFLEKFLGIRWLMPGEVGDYVPKTSNVEIPPTDWTDVPDFSNRQMPYAANKDPLVQKWLLRNKLGASIEYMHGHSWPDHFTSGVYARRPNMFALRDGKRVPPLGNVWICTSNPETIWFLALRSVGHFYQVPQAVMDSITPTDGQGAWCECEQCRALDEKLPNGEILHTRRMVTFYNKVTEQLVQKMPDKRLGGLLYADYIDPPLDPNFKFHPNFYPVYDPAFYYGPVAYRPAFRERFQRDLDGWAPTAEGRLHFYGIPQFLQASGRFAIPTPPGRAVLKSIYPSLKKAKFNGVFVYGVSNWGSGAAYNWVLAKLDWHADTDVDALCDEFYAKCYGKGGPAMSQLNGLLEDSTEKYLVGNPNATYHLNPNAIKGIYLPIYGKLEELYKQAEAATDTEETKKRLELFGWNMRGLYRVLEDFGWLMNAKDSRFYMSESDFLKWVVSEKDSIYIAPGSLAGSGPLADAQARILRTPVKAQALHDALPNAEPVKPFVIRFKNHLLLLSEKEGDVTISFKGRAGSKAAEMGYKVYDQAGNVVSSGQAAEEEKLVVFKGSAGGIYHVFTDSQMIYVKVLGASWAVDTRYYDFMRIGSPHLSLAQEMTPLYFYVPKGVAKFSVDLATAAPGETSMGTLYDPQNKPVWEFNTMAQTTASKDVPAQGKDGQFWKLDIRQAPKGGLDKVHLRLGEEIPGYVCPDPANRLIIENTK